MDPSLENSTTGIAIPGDEQGGEQLGGQHGVEHGDHGNQHGGWGQQQNGQQHDLHEQYVQQCE